jgi:L-cysteine---[L-cysteinyl-carrier protein] ligase PchF
MPPETESLQALLANLAGLNIKIGLVDDQLRVDAPAGTLSEDIKQALRHHRNSLVADLKKASINQNPISWPQVQADADSRNQPFPLTDIQWAYWLGRNQRIELGNVATHFYFELDCQSLDLDVFQQVFRILINRHDMLRGVVSGDGQQHILAQVPPYEIEVTDLSRETLEQQDGELSVIREQMSHQVRAADQWPLFEVRAAKLPEQRTRVCCSWDFLNLDAWSLFLMFREWRVLYENPQQILPTISISYRDYVVAERKLKKSVSYHQARDYWWARLDHLPAAPLLPVKTKVSENRQHRFIRRRGRLNPPLWQSLKQRGRSMGMTPSGILLAAFAEVLALWSKQPHFSLNLTLFNRLPLHKEVDCLIGDFTSILLLEVDHHSALTFEQRAAAIQRQFMQDLQHRQISGVEVLREWSKRQGNALQAAMPVVFTSALALGKGDASDASVLEAFGPMVYGISQTPQVYLDVQVMEDGQGVFFNWDAVEEVFAPGVLEVMFDAYCELLQQLADSGAPWRQNQVLSLPVQQQVQRQAVNATADELSRDLLHSSFIRQALKTPRAVAIATMEKQICYGELLVLSNKLAKRLLDCGINDNELIAVSMEKGWEQVVAVLGILIAGGVYLPIDPNLPKVRRKQYFEQSSAKWVLTTPTLPNALHWPSGVRTLEVCYEKPDSFLQHAPTLRQNITDLAYVIFTSGSTGVPKGVMIDHRGAVNTLLHINRLFGVTASDRVLAVSSLSFDLSVYDIFGVLGAGACMVIPDAHSNTDPEHWLDLMGRYEVSLWNSAPPLMTMLMSTLLTFHSGQSKPVGSRLRLVLLSGDWIPLNLASQIKLHFPASQLISLGGATEASVWSIYYPVGNIKPDWKSIPYGKPLPNQTIHVLSGALQPCPLYVVGDIYIGGIGLATGYFNDSKKTNKHFINHPDSGERLYYTGDLGRYLGDGNIEFLGREDTQVKLHGHRIELGDIVATLRSHPAIDDACMVANVVDNQRERCLYAYLKMNSSERMALMTHEGLNIEGIENIPATIAETMTKRIFLLPNVNADFKQLWVDWNELYFQAVIVALRSMNVYKKREHYSIESLMEKTGIVPRYKKWLQRAHKQLLERSVLTQQEGGYVAVDGLPEVDLEHQIQTVELQLSAVLDFSHHEAKWFAQSARTLVSLLTETTHSAEIYTSEETTDVYQRLFRESYIQLKQIVRELIDHYRKPQLQVLEFGAGLGTATTHILPLLEQHCSRYDFTDISEYFLRSAKQKFSNYDFLQYQLYNLEDSALTQGYESHRYDLVIGVSVLHDVSDIKNSLILLKELLAPGGILLLLEQTKFSPSFDLHMGLQQGFDVFSDENLRQNHPLLSRQQWREVILHSGYSSVEILNQPETGSDHVQFDVLIAQGPKTVVRLDEEKVNDYVLKHLPSYMKPDIYQVLPDFPITANGKIDYKALSLRVRQRSVTVEKIVAPRNPIENCLVDIWRGVLCCDQVSIDSNFFDLGGDSLLLVEVRNQIKQHLDKPVSTTVLFEFPTISALAGYLSKEHAKPVDYSDNYARANKQRQAILQRRRKVKGIRSDA